MKPQIIKVGTFSEDQKGNKVVKGWHLNATAPGTEGFTLDELKAIAIENGTYSFAGHIDVEPLEKFGIVERNENGDVTGFQGFETL